MDLPPVASKLDGALGLTLEGAEASGGKNFSGNDLREASHHDHIRPEFRDLRDVDERSVEPRQRILYAAEQAAHEPTQPTPSAWHDNSRKTVIARDAQHGRLRLRAAAGKSDHRQYCHAGYMRKLASEIGAAVTACVKAALSSLNLRLSSALETHYVRRPLHGPRLWLSASMIRARHFRARE